LSSWSGRPVAIEVPFGAERDHRYAAGQTTLIPPLTTGPSS
jgi:hypothetical protein